MERPELLREAITFDKSKFVVIDEIQKIPALLDEIHWLYENNNINFALCGSSARKIRHGKANLLEGWGFHLNLFGFSAWELGNRFDLEQMINNGYLPIIYFRKDPEKRLNSYVSLYFKKEIAAEGAMIDSIKAPAGQGLYTQLIRYLGGNGIINT